jgi:hypothetical protein
LGSGILKNFYRLFCISILLFAAACAPKVLEPSLFREKSLEEAIAGRQSIIRADTAFSVLFEKDDSEIRGEGVLNIYGNGDLELRVYSLGFLALELVSRDGKVKSNPGLDSAKKAILTHGLRDSIFWWDIDNYTVRDEGAYYLLKNAGREITIDKELMLPVKQQIFFSDGKMITVHYGNPAAEDGLPYQSRMKIELSRYSVTLTFKNFHTTSD